MIGPRQVERGALFYEFSLDAHDHAIIVDVEASPKVAAAAPSPQNVINLMDALKRSLKTESPSLSRKPAAGRVAAKSPRRTARGKDR
jgi:hypothetical protein